MEDVLIGRQVPVNPRGGLRWVIGDVHGSAKTLRTLVDRINLTPGDQLFLLGDYIDRGPDSAGVLDFLLELMTQGHQVLPLRGNHEELLLDALRDFDELKKAIPEVNFKPGVEAPELLNEKGELPPRQRQFLNTLPYFYELDRFFLVHAGFNFASGRPFVDRRSMLWIRNFGQNPTPKTIVHGHEVTDLAQIRRKIAARSTIIPLDNGCYYGPAVRRSNVYDGRYEAGNLCTMDLDSWELVVQENVD